MKPLSSSQLDDARPCRGCCRARPRAPARRRHSRGGTRCSTALTVVSSTDGFSRPFSARQPRQRRHALRDDAGMRRDAVVGLAVPGREIPCSSMSGAKNASARAELRHARAVAADHHERSSPARRAWPRSRARDRRAPGPRRRRRHCASDSGRPGCSNSAGDRAISHLSSTRAMERAQAAEHGGVVRGRRLAAVGDPGVKIGVRHLGQPLERVEHRPRSGRRSRRRRTGP